MLKILTNKSAFYSGEERHSFHQKISNKRSFEIYVNGMASEGGLWGIKKICRKNKTIDILALEVIFCQPLLRTHYFLLFLAYYAIIVSCVT